MKNVVFLLLSLVLVTPAFGTVTITLATGPAPNNVTVGFTSDEPNNIRGFALDITWDDPCAYIVDVNCVGAGYFIYPGSINIDDSGVVTDYGTCLGNPAQGPPGGTQPGLDSNGVTIEMASLYAPGDPPPAQSGNLVVITLSGCQGKCPRDGIAFSVAENTIRGGVVMENPYEMVTVDTSATLVVDYTICTFPCCWGDISGPSGTPDWVVSTSDLGLLLTTLGPVGPPYIICPVPAGLELMDISGPTGVPDGCLSTSDLAALLTYLGPLGPPYIGPCMPDPYR